MPKKDETQNAPPGQKGDYDVGYGKPPLHTRFKKDQPGNRGGRPASSKSLATILRNALDKPAILTENGRRRRVTKREAVIAKLVDKSATADLRATKLLLDILKEVDRQSAAASQPHPADTEVIEQLRAKLDRLVEPQNQPPSDANPPAEEAS